MRELFNTGTGIVLWCILMACAIDVQAQSCDIEHIRGTYTPQIPGQSSECVVEIMPLGLPWAVQTRLTCPGTPVTTNGAVYQLDEEGHCALHVNMDISGVLIAEEGEEILEGAYMATQLPGVSDPDAVCEASVSQWMSQTPLWVAAYARQPGAEGSNIVERFGCEGEYEGPNGPVLVKPGTIGYIRVVGAAEPVYQPAVGTLQGKLRSNGANPPDFAGTIRAAPSFTPIEVTLTRGELPY